VSRKTAEPSIKWKVSIPVTTATRIEQLLFNQTLGKPEYGLRSELVTALLDEYLTKNNMLTLGDTAGHAIIETDNSIKLVKLS
jgi:hypothetical protein